MTKKAMERITRKLAEDGPTIRKVIQSFLSSAQREFLDEALDALIANGRVEEISEPGRGEDVKLFRLKT